MATIIDLLLLIIAIMAGGLGLFYGKSYHVERLIKTTEKWAVAEAATNSARYELKSMAQIFRLKTQLQAELQKARDSHQGNDFFTEFIEDEIEGDEILSPEKVQELKRTLPEWSENAANSHQKRTENAPYSLPIRSNDANTAQLAPIIVEKGRVSIKNPKVGDKFHEVYKIEKQPLAETISFYKKKEAGFVRVFDVPIYELEESKGKPFKSQINYPYLLLCKYSECNNVIMTTAHNAKECGHEDCIKI